MDTSIDTHRSYDERNQYKSLRYFKEKQGQQKFDTIRKQMIPDLDGTEVFENMNKSRFTAYTEFGMPGMSPVKVLKKIIPANELFLLATIRLGATTMPLAPGWEIHGSTQKLLKIIILEVAGHPEYNSSYTLLYKP